MKNEGERGREREEEERGKDWERSERKKEKEKKRIEQSIESLLLSHLTVKTRQDTDFTDLHNPFFS